MRDLQSIGQVCEASHQHFGRHFEGVLKQVCKLAAGQVLAVRANILRQLQFLVLGFIALQLWLVIRQGHLAEVRKDNDIVLTMAQKLDLTTV